MQVLSKTPVCLGRFLTFGDYFIYYKYYSILLFQRAQVSGYSLGRNFTASCLILSKYISLLPCHVHLKSMFQEHSPMYCMNKACITGLTACMEQEAAFLNKIFTTVGTDRSLLKIQVLIFTIICCVFNASVLVLLVVLVLMMNLNQHN